MNTLQEEELQIANCKMQIANCSQTFCNLHFAFCNLQFFGIVLVASFLLLAPPSAARAQVPPLRTEEWKFDVVHRTRGRLPLRGLVLRQTATDLIMRVVQREPGKATVTRPETVPLSEVERVERLDARARQQLAERLDMLTRERALLTAQLNLWKGGKVKVPAGETLVLKPSPWGKDGKDRALEYTSTYFRLLSDARADIVYLTAVQLEHVFSAYVRCLPPRDPKPRQITVLLTRSLEEYGALVRQRGYNILNPAFYDPAHKQVVCGSDLERLRHELTRAKEFHDKLRGDLLGRRKELSRIYNRKVPPELLKPINDSLSRIAQAERRNDEVFKRSHCRLLQRLCHEAFHAYLAEAVFADKKMRVPAWLDEGLAQVFETALVEGGELRLGWPDPERRMRVLKNKDELLPLATLLRASPRQFQVAHAQDRQASDRHYLTAWALAFYLTFGREVLGTPALDDYLKALRRGTEPLEAFRILTGQPLAAFETAFHDYLKRLHQDGKPAAGKSDGKRATP